MSPALSIVIPTFREEQITISLNRLVDHLAGLSLVLAEIIIVDDSDEAARQAIRAWWADTHESARRELRMVVVEGPHDGKGSAVRRGLLASQGDVVFIMDADLPVSLVEIQAFLARIKAGADVVVAERPMARNVESPLRFVLSRGLYAFQRFVVFGEHVFDDTQCGFKAFRGDLARELATKQSTRGGMVDIEYLFLAHRMHARIERVPVLPSPEWRPSKINAWRALRRDPGELLAVKLNALRGRYDR